MSAVCNNARWVGKWAAKYRETAIKDMTALVAVAPLVKLPHARLEHLIGMEARVFPEQAPAQALQSTLQVSGRA